ACGVLVALAVRAGMSLKLPSRRSALTWFAGAALVWSFFAIPLFVRPFSARASLSLGVDLSTRLGPLLGATSPRTGAVAAWAVDMGPIALGLGLAGLAWGLFRKRLRVDVAPLVTLVALSAFLPNGGATPLVSDPLAPLELVSVSALAAAAVLGVQTAALALRC